MPQDYFDLSGRCAVVIGGTSGLGRSIALGLASAGADVVASARRTEEADAAAQEIEALGRRTDVKLISRQPAEREGQHGETSLYRILY